MNKQDFILKLKDPESYDIVVEGVNRTMKFYADTFLSYAWFEVPRKHRCARTWRIIFEVEFGHIFPSLRIEDDITHNFKQSNNDIHVTITTFSLTAKTITVFVTRYNDN